jgi:hypothetical protein
MFGVLTLSLSVAVWRVMGIGESVTKSLNSGGMEEISI